MWYLYLFLILFMCSRVIGESTDFTIERETTIESTTSDPNRTPTPSNDCFIHNFDQGFANVFSPGLGVCEGMRTWIEGRYDSIGITPFHSYANLFVRPDTTHSCISSTPIPMSAGGKLELNVYMELTSATDQIRIIVYEIQDSGNINVGDLTSSLAYSNYNQSSWNTFEIELRGSESFNGQIVISGRGPEKSILIDSLRYKPPQTESEEIDYDVTCSIYTYECVESNLEGYDLLFDNYNEICTGAKSWQLVRNGDSTTIQPEVDTPSCVSTPIFSISSSGLLRVNVWIESQSYFDAIIVAMNDDEGNIHSVGYNRLVNNDFEMGKPYTLELKLEDIKRKYDAQITFVGFATEGATVAVDSFKFTPTVWNGGPCRPLLQTRRRVIMGK